MSTRIRPARREDDDAIWSIVEPVIRAGETYALPRDMTREAALAYWTGPDRETSVAEEDGRIVGTYYLRANQQGGGTSPTAATSPLKMQSVKVSHGACASIRSTTRARAAFAPCNSIW